jgi:hypothetical protein
MAEDAFDFAELKRQLAEHQRRANKFLIPLLLLLLLSLLLFAWAAWYLELSRDPPGELTWKRGLVFFTWTVGTLAAFVGTCCLMPTLPKATCPRCRKGLGHPARAWLVLATGCCPECRQPLFAVEASSTDALRTRSTLITREEFQRQRAEIGYPLPVVSLVLGLFAIAALYALVDRWAVSRQTAGEYGFPIYQFVTILMGGAMLIGSLRLWFRRRQRELARCACPKCGTAISEGPVPLLTGHCTECGAQVFADSPLRPSWRIVDSPMTLREFQDRGTKWRRWGWLCCLLGSIPAVEIATVALKWESLKRPENAFVMISLLVVTGIAQPAGIALCQWWMRRVGSVNCPECGHTLADTSPLVLASRNCPFCATTILLDEQPVSPR